MIYNGVIDNCLLVKDNIFYFVLYLYKLIYRLINKFFFICMYNVMLNENFVNVYYRYVFEFFNYIFYILFYF